MILLAFALADRFHILRAEKEKAQNAAIDAQAAALQAQAEKMSSLTQLVSNVAHEINTPIGAIKSSGSFIAAELKEETAKTLQLATWLGDSERELFIQLISQAKGGADALSSREKRSLSKRVVEQLAAAGVPDAEQKAQVLVRLQAHKAALNYLPLLVHPQSAFIFDTASGIAAILGGTQNIGTAVDRVAKIVTTLKAFAQAGASEVMQPVVLKDGIEVVLASYHSQLKQGVVVVRQYEDVPAVSGHTEELRQAWTHLIHNALQAMAYRGRLAIAVRRVGDEAVVDISDTGSGIADEILPRIFEPFFSTKPQGEGSGLGLSVVKKIVEQHHGRIEVKTAVGVGSTFSVHLPLHTAT
jgi:signal transduction histidine kinase